MTRILLSLFLLLVCRMAAYGATPRWEGVNSPPQGSVAVESRAGADQLEVAVRDGYIYVVCQERVTVKVFTILGQLINSDTLTPGTHRMKISAKGIYILKTDTSTRRVTI